MSLTLTSSDGKDFKVDRALVKHAGTIETLISTMGLDDAEAPMPIPLPNVNGKMLEMVIDWLKQHKDDPVAEETEEKTESRTDDIPVWDRNFMDGLEQSTLFELILAANYLDIKVLLDLTCKAVANMIKGKSTEELRTHFNIKNDFTPEEEEQIRKENAWCQE